MPWVRIHTEPADGLSQAVGLRELASKERLKSMSTNRLQQQFCIFTKYMFQIVASSSLGGLKVCKFASFFWAWSNFFPSKLSVKFPYLSDNFSRNFFQIFCWLSSIFCCWVPSRLYFKFPQFFLLAFLEIFCRVLSRLSVGFPQDFLLHFLDG